MTVLLQLVKFWEHGWYISPSVIDKAKPLWYKVNAEHVTSYPLFNEHFFLSFSVVYAPCKSLTYDSLFKRHYNLYIRVYVICIRFGL